MKLQKALLSLLAVCLLSITVTLLTQAYWQEQYYRFQSKCNSSNSSEHLVEREVESTPWKCKKRVSMGLTVNRQMGQKLTVNRQKRNIFTVNRQMSEQKLAVKFLRYP